MNGMRIQKKIEQSISNNQASEKGSIILFPMPDHFLKKN